MADIAAPADGGARALLRLLTWMSPGFPVGAFAYSHGLEQAVSVGAVRSREMLFDWTRTLLQHGSGWNDLVLFTEAYAATCAGDGERLAEVAELALALGGSKERREETAALGAAFVSASRPWSGGDEVLSAMPYPVAVGRLAALEGVAVEAALAAFAHGFSANLVAAATRLVPLGQSDAVAVLHRLEPLIAEVAARAGRSTLDDLGSAAILSEIAAMRHETLDTRLFRT